MIRMALIAVAATTLAGCLPPPYEAEPASVYQWERKVEQVERQEAERLRVCGTLDKESARYQRECAGVKS